MVYISKNEWLKGLILKKKNKNQFFSKHEWLKTYLTL